MEDQPMIVQPVNALLKSRKFMVALAAIAAYLITLALPDLRPHQSEIATVLLWLAGLVIGGIALEDAGHAVRSGPADVDAAIREVVTDILDELLALQKTDRSTDPSIDQPVEPGS
jgi:hypothetical protein